MERPLALVIDRDPEARETLRAAFEQHGARTHTSDDSSSGLAALRDRAVGIVVFDADLPGLDPQDLLGLAARQTPTPIVIAKTSVGSDQEASSLVDAGVFDVLDRPIDPSRIRLLVRRALRQQALLHELYEVRRGIDGRDVFDDLFGRSPAIERVRDDLSRLAGSDSPVWFSGEAGTGKELAARVLHAGSGRAHAPFAVMRLAGVKPANWSTAWGLDDTGTPSSRGFLRELRGGTLYLEEPAALSLEWQERLLELLALVEVHGLDVRTIAASTTDPARTSAEGRLLESLLRRLGAERVALPTLRERTEDVALLARSFLTSICTINRLPPMRLHAEVLRRLEQCAWPDNVEGLRNAIEQAAILAGDDEIRVEHLPERVRDALTAPAASGRSQAASLTTFREAKRTVVEAFERAYLQGLMDRHGGNVTAASAQAGMLRSALQRLLRKYGLKSANFRPGRRAETASRSARSERR